MEILHFEDLGDTNVFRVTVLTSSRSTGGGRRCGGDVKTIISLNTSFGEIITQKAYFIFLYHNPQQKLLILIPQNINLWLNP